ncbi:MAG: protein kinase domain-containing protein [Sulfuriferula sp.]
MKSTGKNNKYILPYIYTWFSSLICIPTQHPMTANKIIKKLGRYEILFELGQGAMGVVYKAIDPLIGRTVAIKTINLDLSGSDEVNFEERFYREAKSAGSLNHPNIVTIHDIGKADNIVYMAMEFLEGPSLKEVLDVHTAMPVEKIVNIAAQIAHGLAYAHKNGVVHRDIKPANIVLVRGGMAKITDFGIAQMATGSRTLEGTVLGSPKYMAPEQVKGQVVDGRSDLFSLAVVLYEMLTGESPFSSDNINTTMYRIVNEDPIPPKILAPRIPEALNRIVIKALAKNPDERYQSATELAYDLSHYEMPSSVSTATPPNQTQAVKPQTRQKNNVGDATVFLGPASNRQNNNKAAPGNTPGTQTHSLRAKGFLGWQNRSLLIAVIIVLLLTFTVLLMRSKSSRQGNITVPKQAILASTPAPAPIPGIVEDKPITGIHEEGASSNNQFSKTQALPPLPKASPAREPISSLAHKSPGLQVMPPETVTTSPAPTVTSGDASLSFAITPWGEVYVDGKKIGAAPPLKELKIPAGKHLIEIRNMDFHPYSKTIDLQADSTMKIKYIFK